MLLRMFGFGADRAVKVAAVLGRAWGWLGGSALRMGSMVMRAWPFMMLFGRGLLATFGGPLRLALTGLRMLPGAIMWLGRALGGPLLMGLRLAGAAFVKLGLAMLTTPVGWIIMGIAAVATGAYLIYRNWDKVGPRFHAIWAMIKAGFNSALGWFQSLPAKFMQLGSDILNGLINGITSKLESAKNTIIGIGQSIKGWFTNTLGIKSPSRVFMGYGANIGEGAALGILRSVPGVQKAVGKLSKLSMGGALAAAAHAASMPVAAAPAHGAGMGGSGMPIQITYSPQISVGGGAGGQQTADAIQQALRGDMREFERMLERVLADKLRRQLG